MTGSLLLDTHVIIWSATAPDLLSSAARSAIEDADRKIFFSPVSAMEIATKVRIGKLEIARPLARRCRSQMIERGFEELPLMSVHAELAGSYGSANNDPWDRLLAAQAQIENVALVTGDGKMDDFGIKILW